MTPKELQERTFRFSLHVYRYARPLLKDPETRYLAQQLFRAATSVAANYRAACLARTPAEWLAKIGLVREESDETLFWLTFILRAGIASQATELEAIIGESQELTRIFAASYRTGLDRKQGKVGAARPPSPRPPKIVR